MDHRLEWRGIKLGRHHGRLEDKARFDSLTIVLANTIQERSNQMHQVRGREGWGVGENEKEKEEGRDREVRRNRGKKGTTKGLR